MTIGERIDSLVSEFSGNLCGEFVLTQALSKLCHLPSNTIWMTLEDNKISSELYSNTPEVLETRKILDDWKKENPPLRK